jgi:hypothetical protein
LGVRLLAGQLANQVIELNTVGVEGVLGTTLGVNFDDWTRANLLRWNTTAVMAFAGTIQFNVFSENTTAISTDATRQLITHNTFDRNGVAFRNAGGFGNRFVHNTVYAENGDAVRVEGGTRIKGLPPTTISSTTKTERINISGPGILMICWTFKPVWPASNCIHLAQPLSIHSGLLRILLLSP